MALPNVSDGDPHVAAHNAERAAINALETDVQTRIPKPTTPQVGELLRWNGTAWVASQSRLFEGNGQPEGVVAAPIGSRYVDLTGATGATEWLKAHGVNENDNTGWVLTNGMDTGWRNVLASVASPAGSAKYTANIRRTGHNVDVFFDVQTPTANGNWDFYTLPLGFRPAFNLYGGLQDNKENAATGTVVFADGRLRLNTVKGSWRDRFNGQWLTDDPWPGVLPGVAL